MSELAAILFEGAGGSTVGLKAAGYDTIGFEYWPVAVATAHMNDHRSILADLADPANDALIPKVRVLWASPPCQPFSAAGDQEGEFDERDGFPWLLRIIEKLRPEVVFIENVKGLTYSRHDAYFTGILTMLRKLGYEVEWKVLNCADYGVPQTRERCIIIARNDGGRIVWPAPTHTENEGLFTAKWVSMLEALPGLEQRLIDTLDFHADRGEGCTERHGERPDRAIDQPAPTMVSRTDTRWRWRVKGGVQDRATVRTDNEPAPTIAGGNDPNGWTVELNTGRDWQKGGTREDAQTISADEPAPTITGAGRTPWLWAATLDRAGTDAIRCTIEELATLQGFPAGYDFLGSRTAQAKQVGNAVPPKLAQVLAEANRPVTR